jgi:hypothetical protein
VQEDSYFPAAKIAGALLIMHENKEDVEVVYEEA